MNRVYFQRRSIHEYIFTAATNKYTHTHTNLQKQKSRKSKKKTLLSFLTRIIMRTTLKQCTLFSLSAVALSVFYFLSVSVPPVRHEDLAGATIEQLTDAVRHYKHAYSEIKFELDALRRERDACMIELVTKCTAYSYNYELKSLFVRETCTIEDTTHVFPLTYIQNKWTHYLRANASVSGKLVREKISAQLIELLAGFMMSPPKPTVVSECRGTKISVCVC